MRTVKISNQSFKDFPALALSALMIIPFFQAACQSKQIDESYSTTNFSLDGVATISYEAVGCLEGQEVGEGTGILITPNWVITAGHNLPENGHGEPELEGNFDRINHFNIWYFDEVDGEIVGMSTELTRWVKFGLNPVNPNQDIGLIELSSPITEVEPMKLLPAQPRFIIGLYAIEVGCGMPGFGVKRENHTNIRCISENVIITEIAHTRFGDSGGPLILEIEGTSFIAGILKGEPTGHPEYAIYRSVHNIVEEWVVPTTEGEYETGDADADDWPDGSDNCPVDYNPWQEDNLEMASGNPPDGIGDACDNCPSAYNPDQEDSDTCDISFEIPYIRAKMPDGYGNECDMCPWYADLHTGNDEDGDGIMNICDECPMDEFNFSLYNPAEDSDGDGSEDFCDNCPGIPNADQMDSHAENWREGNGVGDACDQDTYMRFWSFETQYQCRDDPLHPGPPTHRIFEYPPFATVKLAYTGSELPDATETVSEIRNAFCDCEDFGPGDYDACAAWPNECSNDNFDINPSYIERANGWIYLMRTEEASDGERGNVARKYSRLYMGEEETQCPEDGEHVWGCEIGDSNDWYYDEGEIGSDIISEITYDHMGPRKQYFEWQWYQEPEIRSDHPDCMEDGCRANVRLYFHQMSQATGTYEPEDAFFYPASDVKYIHAVCTQPSYPPPEDFVPPTFIDPKLEWIADLCAKTRCRNIFPKVYEIDHPNIPDWTRYEHVGEDSLAVGMEIIEVDPYEGKITNRYRSRFENVSDIIDTVGFSAVLEPAFSPAAYMDGIALPSGPEGKRNVWVFGGMDLAGYRNDLWFGRAIEDPEQDAGYSYAWTRYTFVENHAEVPSPRQNATMFLDPESMRIVLFGGESPAGVLSDLWYFDTTALTWERGTALGDVPAGLRDFSATQGVIYTKAPEGVIHHSAYSKPYGFIWGGVKDDGTFSKKWYFLDIATGSFHSHEPMDSLIPAMASASMTYDYEGRRIYLFGGFDGSDVHNWLWSFSLSSLRWRLHEPDCFQGVCPYFTKTAGVVANESNHVLMVFPFEDYEPGYRTFQSSYFARGLEGWQTSMEREPEEVAGDCDRDSVRDPLWGSRCSTSSLWYHVPGEKVCDTLNGGLHCRQDPVPEVDVYSRRVPGLKAFLPRGDILFLARGARLLSYDIANLSSPIRLDKLRMGGAIRDLEPWEDRIVVAYDAGLAVIDASDPGNLVVERRIATCGKAAAVEVWGETAYFVTPLGIGSASLTGEGHLPDRFGFIVPDCGSDWDIMEISPSMCDELSWISRFLCRGHECPGDGKRAFDIDNGYGYVSAQRHLLIVDLGDPGFAVADSLGFDSKIDFLRKDGDFVYLELRRGGTPIVLVAEPASPTQVGEHSISAWVEGAVRQGDRIYRIQTNEIKVAEVAR